MMSAAALAFVAAACTTPGGGGAPANQSPLAIFSPDVSSGAAPLSVNFDASASNDPDGTIVAWNWDFGDFTTGSGEMVSHNFGAGTFTVTLTVTDNLGATGQSSTVISVSGAPVAPTGLTHVGSGCCDTYGDFTWNAVPGVDEYQVELQSFFGGGCLTDHSDTFPGTATSGRVQAFGLCLGSQYDVHIRARVGPTWGPWSPDLRITL